MAETCLFMLKSLGTFGKKPSIYKSINSSCIWSKLIHFFSSYVIYFQGIFLCKEQKDGWMQKVEDLSDCGDAGVKQLIDEDYIPPDSPESD